jgi:regulator of nucleoside diphosphate kinase
VPWRISLTLIGAPRVLVFTPAASKRAVSRTVFAPSGLFSSFVTSTREVVLKQKECAVLPLPKIALTSSDYPRLEQLARLAVQTGDPDGIFLMGEINRADIVPDECGNVRPLVTIGSWVTHCTNWGVPRRTVRLVWPEECWSDPACISVLTPLGAALIGLQVGDQMPYFVAGCPNVVRVQSVTQSDSNVVRLFRGGARRSGKPFDDDPGPTAA